MKEYVYTLKVKGMMCEKCEAHVNEQIKADFDVKKVTSSRKDDETIIVSKTPLDEEKIKASIKETGYELVSIKMEEREKKGLFSR